MLEAVITALQSLCIRSTPQSKALGCSPGYRRQHPAPLPLGLRFHPDLEEILNRQVGQDEPDH